MYIPIHISHGNSETKHAQNTILSFLISRRMPETIAYSSSYSLDCGTEIYTNEKSVVNEGRERGRQKGVIPMRGGRRSRVARVRKRHILSI